MSLSISPVHDVTIADNRENPPERVKMPWYTEDFRTVALVFCIADISVAALNNFLDQSFNNEYDSCCFRIVDSLDSDAISKGHDRENPVPDDFLSPFNGWTIKQVKRWLIHQVRNQPRDGFVNRNFVVIDEKVEPSHDQDNDQDGNQDDNQDNDQDSDQDDEQGTVILCDAQTRMFKSVRIEPSMVMSTVVDLDMKSTMRDGTLGIFWRSGMTCTLEAYLMLSRNGIYFERGVPEIDEEWRAMNYEWRQGGPLDFDSCTDSDESDREDSVEEALQQSSISDSHEADGGL